MKNITLMKPGTQIIYIPSHAEGDKDHPDAERGFVTNIVEDGVFCRFWSKTNSLELRTTSCSELTLSRDLIIEDTHIQDDINELLLKLGYLSKVNE